MRCGERQRDYWTLTDTSTTSSYRSVQYYEKDMEMGYCQGVKVGTLGRQNERNSSYIRLAHTSIFGLCFMSVCLMKSNSYSLIYSSLDIAKGIVDLYHIKYNQQQQK